MLDGSLFKHAILCGRKASSLDCCNAGWPLANSCRKCTGSLKFSSRGRASARQKKRPEKLYSFHSRIYQFFLVCADFSASAATLDPVLNDGTSNVALMAVKIKEELEEQAIAIAPSAERGHY